MPVSGGAADKLANRYEALWVIDQLLRVVDGDALQLTLEPLDPDESQGIEFKVGFDDGTTEYWSVKQQTTKAAGWTLPLLVAEDRESGRSIFGDLLRHVERSPQNRSVFASALASRDFEELKSYARSVTDLKKRLKQSDQLNSTFHKCLLLLCDNDWSRACNFLKCTRSHAADEAQLRIHVNFAIRKLLYSSKTSALDADAIRLRIAELLLENIHHSLDRQDILNQLAEHDIRWREWANDTQVTDTIKGRCEKYTAFLKAQFIKYPPFPLVDPGSILGHDGLPTKRRLLIVGGAGSGKSTVLAGAVEKLRTSGIPVLPLRVDVLPAGILTTAELGQKLQLPESPVMVLAGIANGKSSMLIVDQLDALSFVAGRRSELWSLFEDLRREVERIPEMSLIVGCREFDLTHDHRMRILTADGTGFKVVKLKPLSSEQIDEALRVAEIDPSTVEASFKSILSTPLHLSMFLSLAPETRLGIRRRDELFDRFWSEGERRTNLRLGRKTAWAQVLDRLTSWLSENQRLSAPEYILDEFADDAKAMASEHVLILADGRYRFFHETFFDYAFARRFVAQGRRLCKLLVGDEQHLFRRAQVLQVLSYLREKDEPRYLRELEELLKQTKVRFHVKCATLQWLSALPDPNRREWKILNSQEKLRSHVSHAVRGRTGWFDVLEDTGFFDRAFSSTDLSREEEAISLLAPQPILKERSGRVATILQKYREPNKFWNEYLHQICHSGKVYHSREMFELFLSLIDDGTLVDSQTGLGVNDYWWGMLFRMSLERPDLTSQMLGRWLDRVLGNLNCESHDRSRKDDTVSYPESHLRSLDPSGIGGEVVRKAAEDPLTYAKELMPRVARLVHKAARKRQGYLAQDSFWSLRGFDRPPSQIPEAIFSVLAECLESLAQNHQAELDQLLEPYLERNHDSIAYLVLRAWTAEPKVYADQIVNYLTADSRRLKVGYALWGSPGGSAANYISTEAVRAASAQCSDARFTDLEQAIVDLQDIAENRVPRFRGRTQLELLEALDSSRLSSTGRMKLYELRRKFPAVKQEPPVVGKMRRVPSPVPESALEKMSDTQWLKAMKKYSDIEHHENQNLNLRGGERELAQALEKRVKADPVRFVDLALQMPDDLPASYFNAVVGGVSDCLSKKDSVQQITTEQVVLLIRRVHQLPGRPCGRHIGWLIEKSAEHDWPKDVIEAVAWYAENDPDPTCKSSDSSIGRQQISGYALYQTGINSARGAAAEAIAELLFERPERIECLRNAIDSLARDQSVAVRACALRPLLALLDQDTEKAISWFCSSAADAPRILETPYAEHFIACAGRLDYLALQPIINTMLASSVPEVIEAGARQACLLALDVEEAAEDAERVRAGSSVMRKTAASVYSTNVANEVVGPSCRQLIKPFFADPDESVRTEAASSFQELEQLRISDQEDLLLAFLDSRPGLCALVPVVRVFEASHIELPDLVCRLAEACFAASREREEDLASPISGFAVSLSTIVVRLYAQTEVQDIQTRCLDLIDEMERLRFIGLSDELKRLDR